MNAHNMINPFNILQQILPPTPALNPANDRKLAGLLDICRYFGMNRSRNNESKVQIWDVKSNIPLPLLSFVISKILPPSSIGFNDPGSSNVMKEIQSELCTYIPTGSRAEGLQLLTFSCPEDKSMSDADTFVVPQIENLPEVDVYEYGVVHSTYGTSSSMDQVCSQNDIFLKEKFHTPYPGFVVMTPKYVFKPFEKYISDKWPNLEENLKDIALNYEQVIHGPSIKLIAQTIVCGSKCTTDEDLVYAFPVSAWPSQAFGWKTRNRISKWPPKTLIDKIISQGIHYVKKPPPNLPAEFQDVHDFYWRLSFSLAERDLAISFNDTQRQCALLLKVLKDMEDLPKDVLTSYHMKTIMFWICEKIPLKIWRPHRLAACFLLVLDFLLLCLVRQNIPHYFIPELNLLAGQPQDSIAVAIRKVQFQRLHPFELIKSLGKSYARWYIDDLKEIPAEMGQFHTKPANEETIMAKIDKDVHDVYSVLPIVVEILMILSDSKFQQNNNIEVFKENMSSIEHGVCILNNAITKGVSCILCIPTMFQNIMDLCALAYFTENNIRPYYLHIKENHYREIIKNTLSNENTTPDEHNEEVEFYRMMRKKYDTDDYNLRISQMKMCTQMLKMLFQLFTK